MARTATVRCFARLDIRYSRYRTDSSGRRDVAAASRAACKVPLAVAARPNATSACLWAEAAAEPRADPGIAGAGRGDVRQCLTALRRVAAWHQDCGGDWRAVSDAF